VADVGEEEAFVDGDVGGVLVGGRVSGALISFLFLPLSLLVVAPVTVTT
jgi:hypothetical protein